MQRRLGEHDTVFTGAFGFVQGGIGPPDQGFCGFFRNKFGDSATHGKRYRVHVSSLK